MHRRIRLLLLAVLLLAPPALSAEPDLESSREDGLAAIKGAKAKKHVAVLAGPKCQGRASGEEGCEVAAAYLEGVLTEFGVEPKGVDGYRQTFPVTTGPFPGQRRTGGEPPRRSPTSNLIGVIRGSDPKLEKEAIVIGGHYDHLGFRDLRKGKVFWGADDNASGTSAILLLAEAFAAAPLKPRRSVIFLLFTGEERGLLGSKHYVKSPTWPLSETVFMVNLDMVGRNESPRMDVYGKGVCLEADELNEEFEREARFKFQYKGGSIFQRSDHYSFYEKDIPVLFFTSGLHKDYHDMDDEARKLNYGKIERIAEHVFRLVWEIANRDARPTFQPVPPTGAAARFGFLPVALAASEAEALGLRKDGAVEISEIEEGGPADSAGLAVGEVVIAIAGRSLPDRDPIGELDEIADKLPKGSRVPIVVLRDGHPKTLPIEVR